MSDRMKRSSAGKKLANSRSEVQKKDAQKKYFHEILFILVFGFFVF